MAIEESLEFDLPGAMRQIDAIDAALVQLAQRFSVNLADAVDKGLQTPPEITIDGSGITAQITDAVQAADTTATVVPEGLDVVQSQVADAITAGAESADTAVTVTAEGLDNVGAEITAAVDAADTTVTVEADTQPATDEIENLGGAADVTSGAVDRVATSTRNLDVAAGLAAGEVADLRDALPKESLLGPLAAGLASVALATTASFRAAEEAETADRRLVTTFGDLADQIENVNIGGLSGDLTELATQAGSSDERLKFALSRIAELGRSAGLSDDEIVTFARDVEGLSLRLAVTNPTLGDAGDIADRLTTSLARGGRALAPYGIALSAAEINARALAGSTKTSADELDLAEKAAAGAKLAIEQLGDSLGTDFQAGADQTVISLRSVRQEFDNALEEIGKPLLRPVVEEIRAGLPVVKDLASLFAEAATDVLPLALALTEAAAPALHVTLDVVEALSPILRTLVGFIDAIPDPLLAAAGAAVLFNRAGGGLVTTLAGLSTRYAATAGSGGTLTGVMARMVTPLGLVAGGVAGLVSIIGAHNAQLREEKARIAEVTSELEKQDKTLGEVAQNLTETRLTDKGQLDELDKVNLTIQDISKFALEGRAGTEAFIQALRDGGASTSDFIKLTTTFVDLQTEITKSAQAALVHAKDTGQLTDEQVALSEAQNRNIDGSVNYQKVLEQLLPVQVAVIEGQATQNAAMEDAVDPAKAAGDALASLADNGSALATAFRIAGPGLQGVLDQFEAGSLTAEEFSTVLDNTGLTLEQLQGALAAARDEEATFVDAFVQGIPRVSGATAELSKNHSLDDFLNSIHKQAVDAANFLDNLATLEKRGADSLAATFEQAGIAAASEAAKAAGLSDKALAKRESNLDADLALDARTAQRAEALGLTLFEKTQASVDRIGKIKPPDLTKPILTSLTVANAAAQKAAHDSLDIGITWGTSFAGGIGSTAPAIFRAAEFAARHAKLGAIEELEQHSPSRVMFEVGQTAGLSLALGFDSTGSAIEAAAARGAQRLVLNVPSAVVGGQSGGSSGPVGSSVVDQRQIIVNEVANDPVATAWAVDAALGRAAQR